MNFQYVITCESLDFPLTGTHQCFQSCVYAALYQVNLHILEDFGIKAETLDGLFVVRQEVKQIPSFEYHFYEDGLHLPNEEIDRLLGGG